MVEPFDLLGESTVSVLKSTLPSITSQTFKVWLLNHMGLGTVHDLKRLTVLLYHKSWLVMVRLFDHIGPGIVPDALFYILGQS